MARLPLGWPVTGLDTSVTDARNRASQHEDSAGERNAGREARVRAQGASLQPRAQAEGLQGDSVQTANVYMAFLSTLGQR